jgi:hypothetical protein
MYRYKATGSISVKCFAENEQVAREAITELVAKLNQTSGVHISLGEHHQRREINVEQCS